MAMAMLDPRRLTPRRRHARATRHGLVLLGLLVVVSVVPRLHFLSVGYAAYRAHGDLGFLPEEALLVTSLIFGGIVVDRLGVRRAIFLSLILWSGLTTLNASLLGSLNRLILQESFAWMMLGPISIAGYVGVMQVFHPRRRAIALVLFQTFPFLWPFIVRLAWLSSLFLDGGAAYVMLTLGAAGSAIGLLWWCVTPALDVPGGRELPAADEKSIGGTVIAFFARGQNWILALLVACSMLVASRAIRILISPVDLTATTHDLEFVLFRLGAVVAAIIVAAWSDRILARARAFAPARLPLIAGSFAGAAAMGLLPIVATQSRDALIALIVAAAFSTRLVVVLAADLAPARETGLFVGLLVATADLLENAIYRVEEWIGAGTQTTTAAGVAIAGAVVAISSQRWLRTREPG